MKRIVDECKMRFKFFGTFPLSLSCNYSQLEELKVALVVHCADLLFGSH